MTSISSTRQLGIFVVLDLKNRVLPDSIVCVLCFYLVQKLSSMKVGFVFWSGKLAKKSHWSSFHSESFHLSQVRKVSCQEVSKVDL